MPATVHDSRRLTRAIARFARTCEDAIPRSKQERPPQIVSYSILVAQRRLAEAICLLGEVASYEARLLVRAMLEHYYNLSWIRLRSPVRRANRFINFHVLDKLAIMEALPDEANPRDHKRRLEALRKARARYRHLFRVRDPKTGRLRWTKSWANGLSFEARVREVQSASAKMPDQIDTFNYGLYRWFSAPVHGSAHHLSELLTGTRHGIRPKDRPDISPSAPIAAAGVLLLGVLAHIEQEAQFGEYLHQHFARLKLRAMSLWGRESAT
jgi:hypothetical protein